MTKRSLALTIVFFVTYLTFSHAIASAGSNGSAEIWSVSVLQVENDEENNSLHFAGVSDGPLTEVTVQFEGMRPHQLFPDVNGSHFQFDLPFSEQLQRELANLAENESLGITLQFSFEEGNPVTLDSKFMKSIRGCRGDDPCPSGDDFVVFPGSGVSSK